MDEKIMFWSPCVGLRPFVKPKKGELLKFRPASFETNVQQKRAPRSGGGGGGGGRVGAVSGEWGYTAGREGGWGGEGLHLGRQCQPAIYTCIYIYIYI